MHNLVIVFAAVSASGIVQVVHTPKGMSRCGIKRDDVLARTRVQCEEKKAPESLMGILVGWNWPAIFGQLWSWTRGEPKMLARVDPPGSSLAGAVGLLTAVVDAVDDASDACPVSPPE